MKQKKLEEKNDVDAFLDRDVVSILGYCEVCQRHTFINRSGKCISCLILKKEIEKILDCTISLQGLI